jgi:TonB family protein
MSALRWTTIVVMLLFWQLRAVAQPAEDSVAAARQLYAAAAYEEALSMLDRLDQAAGAEKTDREIPLTRALCLVGLNREADARSAMEVLVDLDPRFDFDPAEASPRVRDLLRAVRAERLPRIIRNRYTTAKQAFDTRDYVLAATRFADVQALLDDPLLRGADADLADLKTLADGFADLSAKLRPPAAPVLPVATRAAAGAEDAAKTDAAATPTGTADPTTADATRGASQVGPGGLRITEPVVIGQAVPSWPPRLPLGPARRATVMVIIDETGKVTSARIVESLNPVYDELLLDAARRWTYRPATRQGLPIMFTKLVTVTIEGP